MSGWLRVKSLEQLTDRRGPFVRVLLCVAHGVPWYSYSVSASSLTFSATESLTGDLEQYTLALVDNVDVSIPSCKVPTNPKSPLPPCVTDVEKLMAQDELNKFKNLLAALQSGAWVANVATKASAGILVVGLLLFGVSATVSCRLFKSWTEETNASVHSMSSAAVILCTLGAFGAALGAWTAYILGIADAITFTPDFVSLAPLRVAGMARAAPSRATLPVNQSNTSINNESRRLLTLRGPSHGFFLVAAAASTFALRARDLREYWSPPFIDSVDLRRLYILVLHGLQVLLLQPPAWSSRENPQRQRSCFVQDRTELCRTVGKLRGPPAREPGEACRGESDCICSERHDCPASAILSALRCACDGGEVLFDLWWSFIYRDIDRDLTVCILHNVEAREGVGHVRASSYSLGSRADSQTNADPLKCVVAGHIY